MPDGETMSLNEALQVLQQHNRWLRTPAHTMEDLVPVAPPAVMVGAAIDVVCAALEQRHAKTGSESYQPDTRGCRNCLDREADCGHLSFESMPVSRELGDGKTVVHCTERETETS